MPIGTCRATSSRSRSDGLGDRHLRSRRLGRRRSSLGLGATLGAFLLIASSAMLRAGPTGTLDTPTFKIKIEVRCDEGEVTCDDVKYTGKNKKTGESITLKGKTAHQHDAEGTPTRFLGYIFKNEGVTYFLNEDGMLRISKGEEVILTEDGTWTWE